MSPPALQRWLFRRVPDRQIPIVLKQRRIFILPTAAGLLFAVALAVMLIGAINYNLGLGHALVFLLVGIGLVAMIHTFGNLFALQMTPGRAEPVFAGDPARFSLQINNRGRRSRRAVELAFAGQATVIVDVPPVEQVSVLVPCATQHRGLLEPGRITLATRYPLGLFRAWSYPFPVWSCLVYPKPIHLPLPPSSVSGLVEQHRGDVGQDDFAGLRQRQDSDPTRHIAWKAVARRAEEQPLLVKQFAGGGTEELWLRWSLTTAADDEDRLSILAGWVLAAERQHARYGLELPTLRLSPARGPAHRAACLRALALFGRTA
ncbi:MAG: DUF58 domain-containing protein [Candidatus Accumulibacter sp.]|nr:DUF58 domain-containing protein [Accumulibacter sp.]